MSKPRKVLLVCALGLAAGLAVYLGVGSSLIAPAPVEVGPPPPLLQAERVRIPSTSGSALAAWAARGSCRCGAVVLLHGIRANRRSLVGRADLLHRAGYSVLLVDLQAHGESPGRQITFGYLESRDARAAVAFARRAFPGEPVGVVGISLGGAAAVLAGPGLGAEAVVLEAVYADLRSATENRLRIRVGALAPLLAPVLLAQLPLRTGVTLGDLRPVQAIARLDVPVLVVAGTQDTQTLPSDTRRLYAAAPGPKALWWVEGAAHEDYLSFAPRAYGEHVLGFFRRYLRREAR
jgi:alpha-beta hydrolase superfamily lysophospholipase